MEPSAPGPTSLRRIVLIAVACCASCGPAAVPPGPAVVPVDAPAEEASGGRPTAGEDSTAAPRGPGAPADAPPPPVPRVLWPRGWRLVDSGSFGSRGDPVAWYTLEGPPGPPEEAVRALIAVLEPHTGTGGSSHVSAPAGGSEAVAQLDGPARRAGLLVRRDGSVLAARVMLHPPLR